MASPILSFFKKLLSTTSTRGVFLGPQGHLSSYGYAPGFTNVNCFFCLCDSRAVSEHYINKDWGSRSTFVPGEHSVKEIPLVDMNKVFLPLLHIKLGLMKYVVKVMYKNGTAFQHLSTLFPGLSAAKLKEGIIVGPQIREVLKDTDFEKHLTLK